MRELGRGGSARDAALVQLVQLRTNDELASDQRRARDRGGRLPAQLRLRAARLATSTSSRATNDAVVRFRIDGILHDIETPAELGARARSRRASRCSRAWTSPSAAARRTAASRRSAADREVELRVSSLRHRLRREGRRCACSIRASLMTDLAGARLRQRRARALREAGSPAPYGPDPRHGAHRLGQDHDALLDAALPIGPRGEHHDRRRSDRDGRSALLSGAGAAPRSTSPSRPRCARSCARTPTSSWSARSATPRPRRWRCRPRSRATWCSRTVHTRDAAGAVTRLVELGVERFLLSSVLRGVLAQRLIRRICSRCAVEGALTARPGRRARHQGAGRAPRAS